MNKVIIGFVVASLSTVGFAKNLEGFKELKFGMTEEQLVNQEFECSTSDEGYRVCYNFSYNNTIFEIPTSSAQIYLDAKNKVRYISISVDTSECNKLLDTMTVSLGQPTSKKNKEANLNKKDSSWYRMAAWDFTNAKMSHMFADLGVSSVPRVCSVHFELKNYTKIYTKPSKDF